eukprot:2656677-Rhodomonas_salina.1
MRICLRVVRYVLPGPDTCYAYRPTRRVRVLAGTEFCYAATAASPTAFAIDVGREEGKEGE